jgi:hypothetical protein
MRLLSTTSQKTVVFKYKLVSHIYCKFKNVNKSIMPVVFVSGNKVFDLFQEGLVMVGQVDCGNSEELCKKFGATTESCVIYWEPLEQHPVGVTHRILGTDAKEIAREVLSFLPEPSTLDEEGFDVGAYK